MDLKGEKMDCPVYSEHVFQEGEWQEIQFIVTNKTQYGHINIILMLFHLELLGPYLASSCILNTLNIFLNK